MPLRKGRSPLRPFPRKRVAALLAMTAHAKRPADPYRERSKRFAVGPGEVAEWSIAPHSKCGVRASVPGVRIPSLSATNPT